MKAYQKLGDCKNGLVEVGGRKTLLKGFEQFEFFYYKNDVTEIYHIVEKSTGSAVGSWAKLSDARRIALERLNRIGLEKFKKMVADELASREVQNGT